MKEPFRWDVCYWNRTIRLARLIQLKAPEIVIERQCYLVLQAIARKHNAMPTVMRWIRLEFWHWRALKSFRLQCFWFRYIRGWSTEQIERHFFGEQDPDVTELNRMFGLKGK